MKKNNTTLKILIIGFGSIGKRHFKNIQALGFPNVGVYDSDPNQYKDFEVSSIPALDEKNIKKFDVALICNPNHLHVETALLCAKLDLHLFIEKPLSHTLAGLSELQEQINEKKLVTMVAANMRFHIACRFIKKYLTEGKLGKIYRISLEFGQYLPFWRPGADHMKGYAVKKETGGGILLDDIHEYDLLFWLLNFAKPITSQIIKTKSGDVTIDSEDQASGVFLFPDNIIGTVSSDYLSKIYRRGITVIGEKGNLIWNFKENIISLQTENGEEQIFAPSSYDTNEMYKEEVGYFLNCVLEKRDTDNPVSRAVSLLKEMGIK